MEGGPRASLEGALESLAMTQGLQTRYLVIKELIDTEAAYMTQLGYLSSWFELLELQGHTNDPVKSTQEALSQMIEAHQEWRALVVAEFNKVDQGMSSF